MRLATILGSLAAALGLLATATCAHQPPAARPELRVGALGNAVPDQLGELRLEGAWSLAGDPSWFGGISGARLRGDRLFLLSDRSRLFELAWPLPPGTEPVVAPLLAERPLADARGRELDAEALTSGPDGAWLVADEGGGRVVRLAGGRATGKPLRLPELTPRDDTNAGIEAMGVLPGGDLVAIAEADGPDGHAGVLVGDGARRGWRYRAAAGFSPTDLAVAEPWLFVLERRLSLLGGWQARIVALPLAQLADGVDRPVEGRELATISGPRLGENYEALAAAREPGGFRLLVISDDNFHAFQRTLLLSLLWPDGRASVAAAGKSP